MSWNITFNTCAIDFLIDILMFTIVQGQLQHMSIKQLVDYGLKIDFQGFFNFLQKKHLIFEQTFFESFNIGEKNYN